ncbi:gliding motility protein [Streptomyces sp. NPDC001401]|uniref:gliding motility protein n=1 Tax=Streptomyces sp. NPDC001401 TaxID=3364570 RepID=UPI0036B43F83
MKGSAEAEELTEGEPTATEAAESASGEGVDIPKQQSVEEAADSDAGEDART